MRSLGCQQDQYLQAAEIWAVQQVLINSNIGCSTVVGLGTGITRCLELHIGWRVSSWDQIQNTVCAASLVESGVGGGAVHQG